MKLKFLSPPQKVSKAKQKPIDKNKIIKLALRMACERLYLEGIYETPRDARLSILRKAEKKLYPKKQHIINS